MKKEKMKNDKASKVQSASENVKEKSTKEKESYFGDLFKFYKENLFKKHLILYIILLVIFFVTVAVLINKVDPQDASSISANVDVTEINLFKSIFGEKLLLVALMVFAGITPFVYIPVLGLMAPYLLAKDLINLCYYERFQGNVIVVSLGVIIQLIGIALAIATGIYYCTLSSKKFRYRQSLDISFNDVKKNFYKATNKTDKLKKLEKKIKEKKNKAEKLNVKIPYTKIVALAIASFLVVALGTLISRGV